ncbi:MAG: hypothetical protein F6K58_12010 [Symploca sp. SIO2E9]|nr:hypothetical protein [Symploca sp. SIO2E9]
MSTASTYSTGTVETVAETARVSGSNWQLGDPIIEPEAVYRLADGRLVMSRDCK